MKVLEDVDVFAQVTALSWAQVQNITAVGGTDLKENQVCVFVYATVQLLFVVLCGLLINL